MYVLPKFSRMTGWNNNLGQMDGQVAVDQINGRMNSQKCTLEVTELDVEDLFGKTNFQDENYYF